VNLRFEGGHTVNLLVGGDQLFDALIEAVDAAHQEVWLATYIFHDDPSGQRVLRALVAAAQRGVRVGVLLDGFGSNGRLAALRERMRAGGVELEVYRPLERWWAWLQPSQLRRLHQKLCVVDGRRAFVGGINIIDDRFDLQHGWTGEPRLDFAVAVDGALAADAQRQVQALWTRARVGSHWREEVVRLARSREPVQQALARAGQMRTTAPSDRGRGRERALRWLRGEARPGQRLDAAALRALPPVRAALVVRDNVLQRRAIERAYLDAIEQARHRIDIASAYFYPGWLFRQALRRAAARGVQVRLLMQGKLDYRLAGLAARAHYAEMMAHGIRVFEYTPAFLHAKVAVVDGRWATVGSSNIDPLSLLLNLEANVVVLDETFAAALQQRLDEAFAASREVGSAVDAALGSGGADAAVAHPGWRVRLQRALVAAIARAYLRLGGVRARY
jgi:cardiolipin synthase